MTLKLHKSQTSLRLVRIYFKTSNLFKILFVTEQPVEIPLQEIGNGHLEAQAQLEEIPSQNVQIEQEEADGPVE